jgi:hypothetical protein
VEKNVVNILQSSETSHKVTRLPAADVIVGYPVMIHAADYRRRAEDCARRANEAQDDFHRKNFSQLAAMWAEMADKADGRAEFVERLSKRKPVEKKSTDQNAVEDALATIRNASTS